MAASLIGLGLLVGAAEAQDGTRALNPPTPYPSISAPESPRVYRYSKPAGTGMPALDSKIFNAEQPAPAYPAPAYQLMRPQGLQTPPATEAPTSSFQSTGFQSPQRQPGTVSPQPLGASPAVSGGRPGDEFSENLIQLEPPGPQELFRLDSEAALQERIRQKARERTPVERVEFPTEPVVGSGPFVQRTFAKANMVVEANYVCYGRLFFEEVNSERYGWDLGPVQPLLSAGIFFKDVAFLPYHAFTDPFRCYDCNSGYCLPGDPVPYMIYPPGLSVTGALAEGGMIAGLFAIFP